MTVNEIPYKPGVFCVAWGSREEIEAALFASSTVVAEFRRPGPKPCVLLVKCPDQNSKSGSRAQEARLAECSLGAGRYRRESALFFIRTWLGAEPVEPTAKSDKAG